MDLRIFTEPQQGATYDDLLRVARAAEDAGYGAFFRSDHYLAMGGDGGPGPTDAWTTLAGLARETSTIRLGTLVSSATFRHPAVLAVQVAQVDRMSGGRVELGLGTGWFEAEHDAFGIPFPALGERFDRLDEQLAIITGLFSAPQGETFSHTGTHYRITENPALARPQQERLPIVVGGGGKKRTPDLAARYATEFNAVFMPLADAVEQFARVDAAATAVGRDPRSIERSAAVVMCVGRDDAEVARRAAAIGREPDELRENGVAGTPAEAVEKLSAYREQGVERIYLQVLDLSAGDAADHLELVAAEVAPQLV